MSRAAIILKYFRLSERSRAKFNHINEFYIIKFDCLSKFQRSLISRIEPIADMYLRQLVKAVACFCLMIFIPAQVAAQKLDEGWWVIVGSFPAEPPERMRLDFDRMRLAVRRCGFQPFNDFSGKFAGFQPGFNVFVVGAYASRLEAERVATVMKKCIPGSYVKFGRYLGE